MNSDEGISKGATVLLSILAFFVLGTCGAGACWYANAENPYTPAGYVGYVTQGAWFGSSSFYTTQTGPSSPGRTWLLKVTNVSITPYTYSEDFTDPNTVLSSDQLKVSFAVHITWKVREDRVRMFIEKYSYGDSSNPDKLAQEAYANVIREPLRSYARNAVSSIHSTQLNAQIISMSESLTKQMQELTAETPFQVISVVVGNIQFPPEVTAAVSAKMAAAQNLEQQAIQLDIAKKQAEIAVAAAQGEADAAVVRAQGEARSMEVVNRQLTNAYLQHEAIAAQAGNASRTVYIPSGPLGIPIVGAMNLPTP